MQPLFENLQASSNSLTKPYGGTATWNGFKFNETNRTDRFYLRIKNNTTVKSLEQLLISMISNILQTIYQLLPK